MRKDNITVEILRSVSGKEVLVLQITEENYILLMKQRQEKALAYFMEKDGWIVKTIICKSSLIAPDERQECMNDTFLAVWRNVERYDENRAAFTTWLAGVTRYCILSYQKKKKRIETISLDEIWEVEDEKIPASDLYYQEEKREFRKLLGGLSLKDQEIFMRLFWDEMDYDQISEEMSIEKPALYSRISRGKKKLRKALERRDVNA